MRSTPLASVFLDYQPQELGQRLNQAEKGAEQIAEGKAAFEQQIKDLAQDPEAFHDLMATAFGEYDHAAAEKLRQQTLAGDFSWMPDIEVVDAADLGGAHGAYDAESGRILLSSDLLGQPDLLAATIAEEAGHHLDTIVRDSDAAGDEGELFRRVLSKEKLSTSEIAAIRAENDHGVIEVNGRQIAVEFWNPFKAVGKAVKKAAKAVGNAVKGAAKGVAKAVGGVAKGIGSFVSGIGEGIWGFGSNLVRGRFGDAFKSLGRGLDKAFIRSGGQILNGFVSGIEETVRGLPMPGVLGKMRDRVLDAGRSVIMGAWNTATGVVRNLAEAATTIAGGFGKLLRGDIGGFKQIGIGILKVPQTAVDAILLGLGKGVSAIQTLIGVEPAGRELTDREIAILREVYGDSIDYDQVRIKEGNSGLFSLNDRPFVHGNTIYMKDHEITEDLLVHEAAHVWQHQNGGSDYMSEALVSQWWGHGYDWQASVPDTAWEDLEPEQQAEFLEQAWLSGYFQNPAGGMVVDGVDYTDYLKTALDKVRNGRGAP